MRTVYAFVTVSVDGFHARPDGSTDWLAVDEGFERYSGAQGDAIDTIVLGRRTFELMASFWPTPQAREQDPVVAGSMNDLPRSSPPAR
ncbi:dihydrofolate reductase family protein [Cellulomonas endophytica]|uniref:dihydrofolate reductase family protein n=1 Tax=Cellulomonas endophytica TaxID=2494735 RepID=UPI0010110920|nr:dihydrofolate reductase family protein [Cellulomonas endophytica]